jgi:hypothetical protein
MKVASLALGVASLAVSTAASASGNYYYCNAYEPYYGRYAVYSTVFALEEAPYSVGIQNSFYEYVRAYDGRRYDTPICFRYDSYQEAEDQKNTSIADDRRDGDSVSVVAWAYHGD